MTPPADTMIWPVIQELVGCLCAEVNADGELCYCGPLVGSDIPFNFTTDCSEGVAYVRLDSTFPSTVAFPQADQTPRETWRLAFNLVVGVLRPAYPVDNQGNVDPDEFRASGALMAADMAAMYRAIVCCFAEQFPDALYVLGSYVPIPLEGEVVGGEWQLTVSVD